MITNDAVDVSSLSNDDDLMDVVGGSCADCSWQCAGFCGLGCATGCIISIGGAGPVGAYGAIGIGATSLGAANFQC